MSTDKPESLPDFDLPPRKNNLVDKPDMKIERGDASVSFPVSSVGFDSDLTAIEPREAERFPSSSLLDTEFTTPSPPSPEGRQRGLKSPLLDLSDLLPHGISPQQFLAGQSQPIESPPVPTESVQPTASVDFELPPLPMMAGEETVSEELKSIEQALDRHLKPEESQSYKTVTQPKRTFEPTGGSLPHIEPAILQSIAVFDEVGALYTQPRIKVTIGAEISRAGLKWVAIHSVKNRAHLLGYGFDEFDPEQRGDTTQNYTLAIERLQKIGAHFKGKVTFRIVADEHIPMQVKLVELPQLTGEEVKKAVEFAVREELSFPEERLEYRQWHLQENNTANQWLLLPFDHFDVEEKLRVCRNFKLSIEGLYPQILTRSKLPGPAGKPESGAYAVLDIGATQTTMVIMDNGKPVMLRDIPVTGDDFTHALIPKKRLPSVTPQASWKEAERIKYKYGFPGLSTHGRTDGLLTVNEVNTALRPLIESFAEELQRSLTFYAGKFYDRPIKKIIAIGGGAQMKRFPEELSARTGIPVESVNLADWMNIPEQLYATFVGNSASYITAALAALTSWDTPLNMQPPSEIRNLRLKAKEPLVATIGGAVVILLLLIQVLAEVALIKTKNEQQMLFNRLMALEPVHQEYLSYTETLSNLTNVAATRKADFTKLFPEHEAPGELVKAVANSAPVAVRLTSVRTGLQQIIVKDDAANRPQTPEASQTAALEKLVDPSAMNPDSLLSYSMRRVMYVDGTIADNALYAEATVLQYVLKLEETKLFGSVKVLELTPVTNRNANARFRLELGLGN